MSALIWIVSFVSPIWFPSIYRTIAFSEAAAAFRKSTSNPDWRLLFTPDVAWFFVSVCGWSFVAATISGIARKNPLLDGIVQGVTGRDWYPSVAHKFFYQNIDKGVVVATSQNRYLGKLHSAPDTKEDEYIILSKVALLPEPGEGTQIEDLPLIRWVLIKFTDIVEIQALTSDALTERKPGILRRNWTRFLFVLQSFRK